MTERTFIRSVHRHLPPELYVWKINANFANGVPDCFYEGEEGEDLWVEYKFLDKLPARPTTLIDLCATRLLSKLQQQWITRRAQRGKKVWVIVGAPGGGVIFPTLEWQTPITSSDFASRMISAKEIADVILNVTHCKKQFALV